MGNSTAYEKSFLHKLYEKYYAGKDIRIEFVLTNTSGKGRCTVCGKLRKLGVRGKARGKCKKCRRCS